MVEGGYPEQTCWDETSAKSESVLAVSKSEYPRAVPAVSNEREDEALETVSLRETDYKF